VLLFFHSYPSSDYSQTFLINLSKIEHCVVVISVGVDAAIVAVVVVAVVNVPVVVVLVLFHGSCFSSNYLAIKLSDFKLISKTSAHDHFNSKAHLGIADRTTQSTVTSARDI
jgi:hypothetical protein